MTFIGEPNKYQPVDMVAVKVADQSELPAAFQEMVNDGYFPFPQGFGKMESAVAIKPTIYVLGWKLREADAPKVSL